MEFDQKYERGRQRIRSYKWNKDKQVRNVSEVGKIKLGNGTKGFCHYCRSKLYNRLTHRNEELRTMRKNVLEL